MCGRYNFTAEEVKEIWDIVNKVDDKLYKSGDIYPTNQAIVFTGAEKAVKAQVMKWGFPKWDGKGVIINAKSETAADKKMFAGALAGRRCVVPATGFYEWQKHNPDLPKTKYLFSVPQSKVLYMAGLYTSFENNSECFVILTQNANETIADIHSRMPVILNKSEIDTWLTDSRFANELFNQNGARLIKSAV